MLILVDVNSILFRNLLVMILYRKNGGKITTAKVTLAEEGIGVPGLVSGSSIIHSISGPTIHFDIQCTMEIRVGSMDRGGMSLPLPFPTHNCLVTGYANTTSKLANTKFLVFGN